MDLALLRSSFELIKPIADDVARSFYGRMLGTFPQIRPLFAHTDFEAQRRNLMATVGAVVTLADKPGELTPLLEKLGQSHHGYGVTPGQYFYVKSSMLHSLAEAAGDAWTAEMAESWEEALDLVASQMIEAQGRAAAST